MFFNLAEYKISNIFDPLPKPKNKETTNVYCKRLSAEQAYRFTKYNYTVWREKAMSAKAIQTDKIPDPKYKEFMEQLTELTIHIAEDYRMAYKDALARKADQNT